mmetsp:Transcript_54456/g.129774  ORF Transcript_54456/g.129774 Transcript_54456/m.129774 type:complete len:558 (+) Transcript_54456:85-1758(+)
MSYAGYVVAPQHGWDWKWHAYPETAAAWPTAAYYYPAWHLTDHSGGLEMHGSKSHSSTVSALAALLRQSGGRRSASAVGHLYNHDQGLHRRVIQSCGGVKGFVKAHPDIFALEPPMQGESCPSIRLVQEVGARKELCKYHQMGICNRGADCRFLHDAALEAEFPTGTSSGSKAGLTSAGKPSGSKPMSALSLPPGWDSTPDSRREAIREQVKFYLSDENLSRDAFFHELISNVDGGWVALSTILSCRRMQQMKVVEDEVLDSLKGVEWLEIRNGEPEKELEAAVRRSTPLPAFEVAPAAPQHIEASLDSRPLVLVRDLSPAGAESWEDVIEDEARRSFCTLRRSAWSEDLLQEEYQQLRSGTAWVVLKSKTGHVTRSTAWYVNGGCRCRYSYSDTNIDAAPVPSWLKKIEDRVLGEGCGLKEQDRPTSVNLNLYLDGNQNVGWHSDDEGLFRGCERDCRIISASWGATRTFEVALKDKNHISGKPSIFRDTLKRVELRSGDLCTMEGLFQKHYSHQLAKEESRAMAEDKAGRARINLTWRYIVEHKPYCPLAWRRSS